MFPALLLSLIAAEPASAVAAVQDDPPVRISINNDRRFVRGDRAKVKVRVEGDGFLLVIHADPDGRVRVLFPLDPDDDSFVRGNRTYEVRGRGDRESFTVDAGSGEGAIYAAVSRDPFRFGDYVVNAHWDYNALNLRALPEDPEPELTELVRRMSNGGFEYDYLTYNVFRYDDVAYGSTVIHRTSYIDPFCGSSYYFRYNCDPYYYSPRYSLRINVGRPYYYDYYDPFYYGYDNYDRYYGRPYYPYRYHGRPYYGQPVYGYPTYASPYPYRNRVTPSGFKQLDRRWDGDAYRDRTGAGTNVQATNTVYGEPPVRRVVTSDPGRSPVTSPSPSRDLSERPSRRRAEPVKARGEDAPKARSQETPKARSQDTPEVERPARRGTESERPTIERAPAPERRAEPVRATPSRSEPSRSEPSRSEPSRAEAAPRSEPSHSAPSSGARAGGGRRATP